MGNSEINNKLKSILGKLQDRLFREKILVEETELPDADKSAGGGGRLEEDLTEEQKEIEKRAEKVDKVIGGARDLGPFGLKLISAIAICLGLYQLYTAGFGQFTALRQRSIHLMFALCIVYFKFASNRNRKGRIQTKICWYDYVLAAAAAVSCLYIAINADDIISRIGIVNTWDIIFSSIIIICVLEATRRAVGYILMSIGIFMLLYCYFGYLFGGVFYHPGARFVTILRHMVLNDLGLWSTPLGVSASFIATFMLLGAALHVTGLAEILLKVAKGLFGTMVGGPAKMAVVASSMFATISGSSTSNVATTGIITIPLMKRTGLKPELAAAVEGAASMGGQITPPIMGAVAFIMAEFLGISYLRVIAAAILPAALYYVGVFSMIHFECHKIGATGLDKSEIDPDWKKEALKGAYLIIPIIVLIFLLVRGRTPLYAAFYAFWIAIVLSLIKKDTRVTPKKFLQILSQAGQTMTVVAIPAALAGFVVGTASLTGLTVALTAFINAIARDQLLLSMFITMLMSLILGMGVPTTANYILMTIMTIPVMVRAGVEPIAAHLFCFHFGIMSELTPPVAITSYTASAIAGGKFWTTAFNAVRLAAVAYIVPYFFVINPRLLLGVQPFSIRIFWNMIVAILGAVMFGSATAGFMKRRLLIPERFLLALGACLLIWPGIYTDSTGFALILLIVLTQLLVKPKKMKEAPKAS